jgi:acyl-CoA thioester hydrolase
MSDEFSLTIPVQYRDLDPMGHVNNAVYASYLEQARTTFIDEVIERDEETVSFVVATLEITYLRSLERGDEATVSLRITNIGTTSCTMAHEIRVDGEVAATAEATTVRVDPESHEPIPIEGALRERFLAYADLDASV